MNKIILISSVLLFLLFFPVIIVFGIWIYEYAKYKRNERIMKKSEALKELMKSCKIDI